MAVYQGSLTVKRRPKDGVPGNPGIPGLPGQVPIQKEWVVGDTHRFNDEIKDFIYVRGASSDTSYWYTRTSKGDDIVAGAAPVGGANVEGYTRVDWLRTLAVNVLLAEEANLANFIFKDGQLLSVRGTVNGVETNYSGQAGFKPYIILDGKTGKIYAEGAEISGVINALSGTIANLIIKDGKLKTPDQRLEIDGISRSITLRDANNQIKTIIHPNNIPSIADYFNDTGAYSADLSTLNTTNLTSQVSKSLIVGGTSSDTFDLTVTPFTIKTFVALSVGADPGAHVEASTSAYIYKNGVFLTEIGGATAHAYKDSPGSSTHSIPATTLSITGNATYTLVIRHGVLNQEDPDATSHGEVSGLGTMTTGKIIDRSEIGTNGMIIATSPQNYTYMVGSLFQVRRGNVFMRITANGIQKSTNGTTWTDI